MNSKLILLIFCFIPIVLSEDYSEYYSPEAEAPEPRAKPTPKHTKSKTGVKEGIEDRAKNRPQPTAETPKTAQNTMAPAVTEGKPVLDNVEHKTNEEPMSLCSDPTFYAANRFDNGSVWLYKEYHYWQLDGLSEGTPQLSGPFPIWWKFMAPVKLMTSVMTAKTSESKISIFRFVNNQFWAYNTDGVMFIGLPKAGHKFDAPMGGLTAVIFNGKPNDPIMIGFRGIKVFYYKFKAMKWTIDGSSDGYVQGRNGENFPGDLDTAFAVPDKDGYIAYFFKGGKYCKRPEKLNSGKSCDEWKDSKELFGCSVGSGSDSGGGSNEEFVDVWPPNPKTGEMGLAKMSSGVRQIDSISYKSLVLVLIIIYFK